LSFRAIAAGLFHSAAITSDGGLVTFGCGKFGQCLDPSAASPNPWTPDNGIRFVKVACGRRHTVALDNNGRVFSFGENKHGQLGRQVTDEKEQDAVPAPVALGNDWNVQDISCGWSHTVALATNAKGEVAVFGWGRYDKGQLGNAKSESGDSTAVGAPTRLFGALTEEIVSVTCGSESSIIVDCANKIWSCGWNEHGNLGSGSAHDAVRELTEVSGAPVTTTPGYTGAVRLAVAAGGAHMLAMRVKRN
jgi:alpha-tubulin suppressor-like RCC1 family protein